MGSSLASRRRLDGPGPLPVGRDRPVFRPETPRLAAPGTIHVAYGRRFGGSTDGYRTVALPQHPRSTGPRGHEEAAPLSRRRSVKGRLTLGVSGPSWSWPPSRRAARPALPPSPRRARPWPALRAAVRSALAASRAAVRSALAVSRASVRSALSAARSSAATAFSCLAASKPDASASLHASTSGSVASSSPSSGSATISSTAGSVVGSVGVTSQATSWWAIQLT